MRGKTKKYIIPIWYLIMLIFTGGFLCLHFIWKDASNYSVSFTQFGPVSATFMLICIVKDKHALQRIQNGLRFHKQAIVWCVLAVIIPLALTGISGVVLALFFNSQHYAWNGTWVFYFISFFAMLLGSIGEEIGWRGYLLPTLNKKVTPFLSSIITGCLWGFWHLNYTSEILFWLLFILTTVELSIIFTFFLNRSNGNLWTVIIFHTFFNLANRIFIWERFNISLLLIEIFVFGFVCAIIMTVDKKAFFKSQYSMNKNIAKFI